MIRYRRQFDIDGIELDSIPYEVTSAQIQLEAIESETAQSNDNSLVWYNTIDNMGIAQLRQVVKVLLGDFIVKKGLP